MKTIKIDHIGKTEGHLGFEGTLQNGDIASARVMTLEGARLMEGIVLNRSYYDVPIITSRICGVCPIVHNLGAIKALEHALNVVPTDDAIILRKILNLAQIIHSHALHVVFLSFPDFIGVSNNFDLVKKYPKEVALALEVHDWSIRLGDLVGGRTTHPINSVVGGFKVEPDKKELQKMYDELEQIIPKALRLVAFVKKHSTMPDFENPTDYISLVNKREYAFYSGNLYSSDLKERIPIHNYFYDFEEQYEVGEAVKRVKHRGRTYMVGALARINNSYLQLNPVAKGIWDSLKVKLPCYNSFYNNLAQVVELVHSFEEAQKLMAKYLKIKQPKLFTKFKPNPGKGVGAIEAPRGTLYHYYELNRDGVVVNANIITPTAMFLANIEFDLVKLLPQIKNLSDEKQKLMIKTLIRAYDPCISCATH